MCPFGIETIRDCVFRDRVQDQVNHISAIANLVQYLISHKVSRKTSLQCTVIYCRSSNVVDLSSLEKNVSKLYRLSWFNLHDQYSQK